MRVRFAPSPTGHLHVGNARTALFNWLLARHGNGKFILRIEDTDAERSTRDSERAIANDLQWLGLQWDEGIDVGGAFGPYRQSERLPIYQAHADRLLETGHAYLCFCSPEKLEADRQAMLAAGLPPKYAGTCRAIDPAAARARVAAGEPAVVRLRVPAGREVRFDDLVRGAVAFQTEVIGDPVLLRSDGMPAYNFAVVVDDALMKITHVVRGEDHVSNTPRQLLLYEAFGWDPPRFAHLSMVLGPDHAPLSKRHGATSVAEFRAKGYLPEALANYLALIGWSPGDGQELFSLDGLARRFDLANVAHSAGVFDEGKLAWANRHHLKLTSPARLVELAQPFLMDPKFLTEPLAPEARAWLESVLPAMAASVDRLPQIAERLHTVFAFDARAAVAREPARQELADPAARKVIAALAADLARAPRLVDRDRFRAAVGRVKEATGLKGRELLHPIRVALTGESEGPELDVIVPAIDRGAAVPLESGLAPITGNRERAAAMAAALGL
jgi:glutamyl-tRNA synthetase